MNKKLHDLFASYVRARDLADSGYNRMLRLTTHTTNWEKALKQYEKNSELAEKLQGEIYALIKEL